jgi:hypothetical protein
MTIVLACILILGGGFTFDSHAQKATPSCEPCVMLAMTADEVRKTLEEKAVTDDQKFESVKKIRNAIVAFVKTAGEFDSKKREFLIKAWSVVALHDPYVSIPTEPEIFKRLKGEQFQAIQKEASVLATRQDSEETKRAYLAVSLSILQAEAEQEGGNAQDQ